VKARSGQLDAYLLCYQRFTQRHYHLNETVSLTVACCNGLARWCHRNSEKPAVANLRMQSLWLQITSSLLSLQSR